MPPMFHIVYKLNFGIINILFVKVYYKCKNTHKVCNSFFFIKLSSKSGVRRISSNSLHDSS